jgi:hypothetical protein
VVDVPLVFLDQGLQVNSDFFLVNCVHLIKDTAAHNDQGDIGYEDHDQENIALQQAIVLVAFGIPWVHLVVLFKSEYISLRGRGRAKIGPNDFHKPQSSDYRSYTIDIFIYKRSTGKSGDSWSVSGEQEKDRIVGKEPG